MLYQNVVCSHGVYIKARVGPFTLIRMAIILKEEKLCMVVAHICNPLGG